MLGESLSLCLLHDVSDQQLVDNEEPIVWHEPILDEYWGRLEAEIDRRKQLGIVTEIESIFTENEEGGGGPPHQWNMTSGNDLKVKKTACAVMRRCLTRLTIRLIMKTITKMARHVQLQHLPHRLHGSAVECLIHQL